MLRILDWIRTHLNQSLAIVAAAVILTLSLYNSAWWGDRAFGVLIGVTSIALVLIVLRVRLVPTGSERTQFYLQNLIPWILVIIPTATALVFRSAAGYKLVWPIELKSPTVPQPQSLFLILTGVLLMTLLIMLVRALSRGEGVAIESHWGGLGGGIGGFQLSTPLIYLLGIVFLLALLGALAWRVFPSVQNQPAAGNSQSSSSSSTRSATAPVQTPPPATSNP